MSAESLIEILIADAIRGTPDLYEPGPVTRNIVIWPYDKKSNDFFLSRNLKKTEKKQIKSCRLGLYKEKIHHAIIFPKRKDKMCLDLIWDETCKIAENLSSDGLLVAIIPPPTNKQQKEKEIYKLLDVQFLEKRLLNKQEQENIMENSMIFTISGGKIKNKPEKKQEDPLKQLSLF